MCVIYKKLVNAIFMVGIIMTLNMTNVAMSFYIKRHYKGDLFTLNDYGNCTQNMCSESGRHAVRVPWKNCNCQCLPSSPTFRQDIGMCVDTIKECRLVTFRSPVASENVPFVFAPHVGKYVHPNAELVLDDITHSSHLTCYVLKESYLTDHGWFSGNNSAVSTDLSFQLVQESNKIFLQFVGTEAIRADLLGQLILVELSCQTRNKANVVPHPCAAFRVAGLLSHFSAAQVTQPFPLKKKWRDWVIVGLGIGLLGVTYILAILVYLVVKKRQEEKSRRRMNKRFREEAFINIEENFPPPRDISNCKQVAKKPKMKDEQCQSTHFKHQNSFLPDDDKAVEDNLNNKSKFSRSGKSKKDQSKDCLKCKDATSTSSASTNSQEFFSRLRHAWSTARSRFCAQGNVTRFWPSLLVIPEETSSVCDVALELDTKHDRPLPDITTNGINSINDRIHLSQLYNNNSTKSQQVSFGSNSFSATNRNSLPRISSSVNINGNWSVKFPNPDPNPFGSSFYSRGGRSFNNFAQSKPNHSCCDDARKSFSGIDNRANKSTRKQVKKSSSSKTALVHKPLPHVKREQDGKKDTRDKTNLRETSLSSGKRLKKSKNCPLHPCHQEQPVNVDRNVPQVVPEDHYYSVAETVSNSLINQYDQVNISSSKTQMKHSSSLSSEDSLCYQEEEEEEEEEDDDESDDHKDQVPGFCSVNENNSESFSEVSKLEDQQQKQQSNNKHLQQHHAKILENVTILSLQGIGADKSNASSAANQSKMPDSKDGMEDSGCHLHFDGKCKHAELNHNDKLIRTVDGGDEQSATLKRCFNLTPISAAFEKKRSIILNSDDVEGKDRKLISWKQSSSSNESKRKSVSFDPNDTVILEQHVDNPNGPSSVLKRLLEAKTPQMIGDCCDLDADNAANVSISLIRRAESCAGDYGSSIWPRRHSNYTTNLHQTGAKRSGSSCGHNVLAKVIPLRGNCNDKDHLGPLWIESNEEEKLNVKSLVASFNNKRKLEEECKFRNVMKESTELTAGISRKCRVDEAQPQKKVDVPSASITVTNLHGSLDKRILQIVGEDSGYHSGDSERSSVIHSHLMSKRIKQLTESFESHKADDSCCSASDSCCKTLPKAELRDKTCDEGDEQSGETTRQGKCSCRCTCSI